jgi:hypothetical protein
MSPANGVTVVAYYVIPYTAIVNQCSDLYRIHTRRYSFQLCVLFESERSAFFLFASLAHSDFFFAPASSRRVYEAFPLFSVRTLATRLSPETSAERQACKIETVCRWTLIDLAVLA